MSKSVLVLGGAGFLGTEILQALRRQGIARIGSADRQAVSQPGVESLAVDILDVASVERACQNYEVIINCVGQVTNPITTCFRLNSDGITNLAAVVRPQSKHLIQISTIAVYGTAERVDETSPLNPETPYATCKAMAEFLVRRDVPDNQQTILRLSNLYGEHQTQGLGAYLMKAYRQPQTLTFNNDGSLKRYYLHVSDAAEIIARVAAQPAAGTYNLIGPEQHTLKEVLALFERTTGRTLTVDFSPQPSLENVESIDDRALAKIAPVAYTHSLTLFFQGLMKPE